MDVRWMCERWVYLLFPMLFIRNAFHLFVSTLAFIKLIIIIISCQLETESIEFSNTQGRIQFVVLRTAYTNLDIYCVPFLATVQVWLSFRV